MATAAGVDGIELDIHSTRSGDLVVHHDADIAGLGPIVTLDLEAVRRTPLSNGEVIPTLAEALEVILGTPGTKPPEVWIEVKQLPPARDGSLIECVDRSPRPDRCAIHSFDHRIIRRLGTLRPSLRRGILSVSHPIDPVTPLKAAGASVLWQEWQLIDQAMVDAVHAAGSEVIAWTVNDAGQARALSELGIDGLCGNWPERLKVW